MVENKFRKQVRKITKCQFIKTGICNICGTEEGKTTWHHSVYRKDIKKTDIVELCIPCHKRWHKDREDEIKRINNELIYGKEEVAKWKK